MSSEFNPLWPMVALKEILSRVKRQEIVEPHKTYQLLGAHWYAKGLYTKNAKPGTQIRAKYLYRVEEDDFVYNRLFAWKGSFAVATAENAGCYVSNEFPCFRMELAKIDPQYLWYYFSREDAWNEALALSHGATPTSRNRLKETNLLSLQIPLPPLDEQRRIIARIESLAAKVEAARELREQAEAAAASLLLSSTLREIFINYEEGKDCEHTTLGEATQLQRGRFSHRPRNEPMFFGGDHPWIQIGEIESAGKYITVYTKTLNDTGLKISRKFPKGTLLISIAATIGAVGILAFDCCVPDSIVAVTPYEEKATSEFLYYYLMYVRNYLEEIAPQSAQKNINLRILNPLPISLPPLPEQRRIVAYLDALQAKVTAVQQHQAATQARLNALLPSILDQAFRGEL